MEVKKTLALHNQKLMLEEDEVNANSLVRNEAETKVSTELPFTVPFDTKSYAGSFGRVSNQHQREFSGQVFYKIDTKYIHIGMVSNNGFIGVGLNGRNPSMRNADIVVCRDWKSDNKISARDFHATGNKAPQPDDGEDWTIDESGKQGDLTYCVMHR